MIGVQLYIMPLFLKIGVVCFDKFDYNLFDKNESGNYHMVSSLVDAKAHHYFTKLVETYRAKSNPAYFEIMRILQSKILHS